jgi:predicted amidohydrolase
VGITVGVAQFGATTDRAANRENVAKLVEHAASGGAELVVLPENSMYSHPDSAADISSEREDLDGEFGTLISKLAAQHRVTVVAGMTEINEANGKGLNTVLAVGNDGSRIGVYRKVHLYDAFGYKESDRVQAADFEPLTFEMAGLTFGVMTCYDLRFPEIARALVDAGANTIVVPAAWAVGPGKEDHWTTLLRARAIENTVHVIAAGQTAPHCTGLSMVIDPMGIVVANAGEVEGVASAHIDSERVNAVRAKNPSLANRRFSVSPK